MLKWFGCVATVGAIALVSLPANAQTCSALKAVGAAGSRVEKKVSPPGASIALRNNWNTDFSANPQAFSSYVATITPKNEGLYTIQMNLKYANDSVDKVFDEKVQLKQGQPYKIKGSARLNGSPYQVNLAVGGVEVVGNTYVATVAGCR